MKLKEVIVYLFKGDIDNVHSLSKIEIQLEISIPFNCFNIYIHKPHKEVAYILYLI